jgi:hypothetical protein
MRELNIKEFINEMSWNLSLQEAEEVIVKYQDTIINFIVNNQYNYKNKHIFKEVCEIIRQDRFFQVLACMINDGDSRVKFDMAYVLYTATHFPDVDSQLINDAAELGYELRRIELEEKLTQDNDINTAVLICASKAIRDYEVTSFFRSKEVENIIETLPGILYFTLGRNKGLKPNQVSDGLISTILSLAIPDLEVKEVLAALGKSVFPKDLPSHSKPFAIRIQSYLYKICATLSDTTFNDTMIILCKSINKYNERTGLNESFMDKYLNYRLLVEFVKSGNQIPQPMLTTCGKLAKFVKEHPEFNNLF